MYSKTFIYIDESQYSMSLTILRGLLHLYFYYPFYFDIIVDSHIFLRHYTEKSYVPLTWSLSVEDLKKI